MNERTVNTLIQVAALATASLLEYLREPPADDDERELRDRATMALMEQSREAGRALLASAEGAPPDGGGEAA